MKTSSLKILLIVGMVMCCLSVMADDYDVMRLRLRDQVVLGPTDYMQDGSIHLTDPGMPQMQQYLTSLSSTASGYWQTMRKDTTYLWDDVSLLTGNKSFTPAHIYETHVRLLTLARAWAYPGTDLYADPQLLLDIRYGLALLYRVAYNEHTRILGNWWEWRIGVPWAYTGTICILYDELTPEEITCFEKSTSTFVRSFARNGDLTYANQASLCRNLLAIGILAKKPKDINNALTYVIPAFCEQPSAAQRVATNKKQDTAIRRQRPYGRVSVLEKKEGLYEDGSFIQHTSIPYIGTYGTEIIAMAGYMACLIPGTQFEVPQSIIDILPVWINNAYLPAMYRGEMMMSLMGRANAGDPYSNARNAAISIMDAALFIPDSTERQNAIVAASNALAHNPHYGSPYDGLTPYPLYKPYIDAALSAADSEGKEEPFSVIWAAGDRAIHQTADWRFSVSMSSNRIGKYECFMRATGNQNTTGWYSGDGMTYLYLPNAPKHYFRYLSNVNPYRLPGTTVDLIERKEVESVQPLYGHRSQAADIARAGGVSFRGLYSAAAMQLLGGASALTAKKAWFMFDNEVVCLGADINLSDSREVITTIENRRSAPALSVMTSRRLMSVERRSSISIAGARLAYVESVGGYYFPDTITLHADLQEKDNTAFWLSHGEAPQGASYSYVLLPTMSRSAAQTYAGKPEITILSNTPSLQAVCEVGLGITSAIFWEACSLKQDSLPSIRLSGPAAVMMQQEGDTLYLSISDPTWDQAKQTIIVEGRYRLLSASPDDNVRIVDRNPLAPYTYIEVNQKNRLGMTQEMVLVSDK